MKNLTILVLYVLELIFVLHVEAWNYNHAQAERPKTYDEVRECDTDIVINKAGEKFKWKYFKMSEVNYFASEPPICWDANRSVVIRKCNIETGSWIPENKHVNCELIRKVNQICPEDLKEIPIINEKKKFLCIKKSNEPHKWNEKACYGSDTIIDKSMSAQKRDSLLIYLQKNHINSFWLPAFRSTTVKYDPFIWKLPGEHWGELLDVNIISTRRGNEQSLNENCIIVNVTDGVITTELVHCNSKFLSICILENHLIAESGCPQNFKALSYRPNECYGIHWHEAVVPNELAPLSIQEYYNKRNILGLIFDAFKKRYEHFFLLSETEIDQVQFNLEMNAKENLKIMPRDQMKPTLSKEILKPRKNVEMTLKIDSENKGLVLTVYNRNYIWRVGKDGDKLGIKCFTNADYEYRSNVQIEEMIWENERQTKSIFEIKLNNNGPGYYWCEAHTVFNFEFVSTPMIVASKKQRGHPFAVFFDLNCTIESNFSPYTKFKIFAESIKKILKGYKDNKKYKNKFRELIIDDVRVMNIESINAGNSTLRVLCHITVWKTSSSVDNKHENSSEENDSEENECGICHDTGVRLQLNDLLKELLALENLLLSQTVNSTEYCFPQPFIMMNGELNQWYQTKYGQTSTTQKLCLQNNGLPATRECKGDLLYGAYWEPFITDTMICITKTVGSTLTKNLYALDSSKLARREPKKAIKRVKELLEENINNLIPADFYYIGKIIQKSLSANIYVGNNLNFMKRMITAYKDNNTEVITNVVRIFNYLMKVKEDVIQPSIKLNSTNVLLDAFENFIDNISMLEFPDTLNDSYTSLEILSAANSSETSIKHIPISDIEDNDKYIERMNYEDIGVVVKITTKLVIFIINPNAVNVTGIAIFNRDAYKGIELSGFGLLRGAFKNLFYRFILANQSVSNIFYEPGLQLATFIPESLLNRLDEIDRLSNHSTTSKSGARIVLKLYSNDVLFQEERRTADKRAFGTIISISIPGQGKDLPEMLPLILRTNENPKTNETLGKCGYWSYKTWMTDGIVFLGSSDVDKNLIVCGTTHLTPFAFLIGENFNFSSDSEGSEVVLVKKVHKAALDIITLLSCLLSLFGVAGITITAIVFESWRRKASTKVLLQLSAAIALQMILFCFVNTEGYSHYLIENQGFSTCIALGAALQYSILVQFCWIAIIAYLQFKRYVQIFGNTRPKRFVIKSTLIGWGLPILPVLCLLLIDRDSYIPSYSVKNCSICYPTGYSLYTGVIIPILLVIVANFFIFLLIIYKVLRGPEGSIRHTEKNQVLKQIRLTFLLFFLLGFTWIFGLLSIIKAGILFSYLFCLTATLQGFVLFIYFIVLDPITRRMWYMSLRRFFKLNRDSSNNMKETTTTTH